VGNDAREWSEPRADGEDGPRDFRQLDLAPRRMAVPGSVEGHHGESGRREGIHVTNESARMPAPAVHEHAGASFAIAKVFAVLFAVLFLIFLILGLSATSRIAA
jgi:hypothetical protein